MGNGNVENFVNEYFAPQANLDLQICSWSKICNDKVVISPITVLFDVLQKEMLMNRKPTYKSLVWNHNTQAIACSS